MNKYIIKIQRTTLFMETPYIVYIAKNNNVYYPSECKENAHKFTFNEKDEYLKSNTISGTVMCEVVSDNMGMEVER